MRLCPELSVFFVCTIALCVLSLPLRISIFIHISRGTGI